MNTLVELFCHVDVFFKLIDPLISQSLIEHKAKRRTRPRSLGSSENMTLMIHFHQNRYRNFKHYYIPLPDEDAG